MTMMLHLNENFFSAALVRPSQRRFQNIRPEGMAAHVYQLLQLICIYAKQQKSYMYFYLKK